MGALHKIQNSFDNLFDITKDNIEELELKETKNKNNCFIWNRIKPDICYTKFVIDKNSRTTILCAITFYKSSQTNKYIPRLTFKKVDTVGENKNANSTKPIIISFNESKKAQAFWKFIGFLAKYKELVDTGEFDKSYKVAPKEAYWVEFETKAQKDKIDALKELILKADLDENGIKSIVFESRKKHLKTFLNLIKNLPVQCKNNQNSIQVYKDHYKLSGQEAVWHHFLKKYDWILGLNIDIKFIRDFYDEQKVGLPDSKNRNDPQVDLLGISDYTTLIELKHSNTGIFKQTKTSKSRSNTWDFTTDFIEGISQCLSQKTGLEKSAEFKNYVSNGERLNTLKHKTIDPAVVFIIGNRKVEFPHNKMDKNHIKSETFERFRRNSRNVDIITYDELFERAYHTVLSKKIDFDWYENPHFSID